MQKNNLFIIVVLVLFFQSCGNKSSNSTSNENKTSEAVDSKTDKGIGPVTSLILPETIDQEMVKKGQEVYQAKCTACHKPDAKYIGPAPKGIFERRSPEFIMNMILNPEKMIAENETVKKMIGENNGALMANQNLTQDEARAVLEYFRTL